MQKNDELNGMIDEMRDLHENRGGEPDKNRMEQSVIRRLVSGIRIGRIIIALLVVFIAAALIAGVYWKFFRPYRVIDNGVTWKIGDIEVTTTVPDDEDETRKISHWVGYYDPLLRESSSFRIVEPYESIEGSAFIVDVNIDDDRYLLFPDTEKPRNMCFSVYGSQAKATREIDALAKKMLSVKLWPVPLWKLRPVVKLLKDRKYGLISPGPYSCYITATKKHFGNEYVYTLRGLDWGAAYLVNLTIWPDHFAIQPSTSGQFTLLGDESGYTAYQQEKYWGSNVKEKIVRSKKTLWMHPYFLELSPCRVSPDFSRSLSEVVDVLWQHGPDSLQSASLNEQRMMIKPWYWEGYEPEMEVRRNEYRNTRPDLIPCTIGGVDVSRPSRPERYVMRLGRGETSLNINSNYTSVGTYVDVKVNDEDRLKFYIRHEKPYPVLETTFDEETEALLTEAADIASAVLAEPASAWPEGRVPEPYLESWLGAIASRRIVLETESHRTFVNSEVHWQGDDVAMAVSFGEYDDIDMDVLFRSDGFELLLKSSKSLLTSKPDRGLFLHRAPGGREEVLTTREIERLHSLVAALDAIQEYEVARVSPQSEASKEGDLDNVVPEGVLPGIEELRRFLANPEVPPVKTFTELPGIDWDYAAVLERDKYLFP